MSADPKLAFRMKGLTHHYYPERTTALLQVTVDLPAGETVAVLGPSGSGKSTLLSLLGLLWDDKGPEGELWFHDGRRDHNLLQLPRDDRARLRSAAFGFVLQSSYLLPHFTSLQNVGMPLAFHGWPAVVRERWADALLSLDEVDPGGDLRQNRNRVPRKVSLGQRQRYGVLRAVIADPMVVFADEPSSNLDPGNTLAMFKLLARWQAGTLFEGLRKTFTMDPSTPSAVRRWFTLAAADRPPRTLVLVCHDVQTARRTANRFLLLNQGHTLEASFSRAKWDQNAETLERILGLPAGAAGRDHP